MPRCAPPESLQTIAIDGGPVTWIKQYDMRPALGNLRQRSPQMRSLTWVRLSNDRNLSFVTLTALSDASFPRIFYHYDAPSPIATVTMSVHFHAAAADLAAIGGDFVLIEASNQLARDGFFDQHVRVWSRGGDLLATSTQLVWFDVSNPS